MQLTADALTFAELEALAGLGLAGFLALDDACVAGHEAFGAECGLNLGVVLDQGSGDGEAECLGLTFVAAAVEVGLDVEAALGLDGLEGLLYDVLKDGRGEINLQRALVDGDVAGSLGEVNACYRSFATANGIDFSLLMSIVLGFWLSKGCSAPL